MKTPILAKYNILKHFVGDLSYNPPGVVREVNNEISVTSLTSVLISIPCWTDPLDETPDYEEIAHSKPSPSMKTPILAKYGILKHFVGDLSYNPGCCKRGPKRHLLRSR